MHVMHIENFDGESLLRELESCFSKDEVEELSRTSKFVQRSTSRLTGLSFLMMNVFDSSDGKERSLNDCCDWLEDHFEISMAKQSLDERFNTDAVSFMRQSFNRILGIVNGGVSNRLIDLPFSRIQLTDSTSFQIPSNLSTFYLGYIGNGGESIIKMHLNYNLLNGEIADIFLTDGVAHDNLYKKGKHEKIEPKGLYIKDLGYYDAVSLNKIAEEGAYFLSRSKSNSIYSLLNEKGKHIRIDIADHLPKKGKTKELDVYVGAKTKVSARLIMQSVPEEIAMKRLEKLEKNTAKQKGRKVSEQAKKMCWFNMYITNASKAELPASIVRLVYTLRWQIELMFKIWKSVFDIDKVKSMSIFRFECYIYSKLIAILLTLHIQNKLGQFLWDEDEFEISPIKAAKLIKKNYQA